MGSSRLSQFEKRSYLNLETFRKSGQGVPTPVWFAEDQGVLYVTSDANAGKVKRIRNNGRVRVAPCDGGGGLLGEWVEAQARLVTDPQVIEKVKRLFRRKYGLTVTMFNALGRLRKNQRATIAIEMDGSHEPG
jgi:PPOX class probable F420-dependent enzyme